MTTHTYMPLMYPDDTMRCALCGHDAKWPAHFDEIALTEIIDDHHRDFIRIHALAHQALSDPAQVFSILQQIYDITLGPFDDVALGLDCSAGVCFT